MSLNINLQLYWAMGHYKQSFKITNLGAGTLLVKFHSNEDTTGELYYKTGRFWLKYDRSVIQTIDVKTCVYFRGSLRNETSGLGRFELTGSTCSIGGDLVSLCSGITDEGTIIGYDNILPDDVKFSELFGKHYNYNIDDDECIEHIENLVLPRHENVLEAFYRMFIHAKNLRTVDKNLFRDPNATYKLYLKTSPFCYTGMFEDCVNLENSPELGADIMSEGCYCGMFYGCTHLHEFPVLNAQLLAEDCYNHMFYNCKNLVKAPTLPAKELFSGCYVGIFGGCDNLKEVTMLGEYFDYPPSIYNLVTNSGEIIETDFEYYRDRYHITSVFATKEAHLYGYTPHGWLEGVATDKNNATSSEDYTFICSSNWQNSLLFNMYYEKYKDQVYKLMDFLARDYPEARNIFTYIVPSTLPRVIDIGVVGSLFPYYNLFGSYDTKMVETAWHDPIRYADNYGNIYLGNWWPSDIRNGWQIMTESGEFIRDWDGNYNPNLNNII